MVTREHLKHLKELQANSEIMLVSPDKGAGSGIINNPENIEKTKTILSDESNFANASAERG